MSMSAVMTGFLHCGIRVGLETSSFTMSQIKNIRLTNQSESSKVVFLEISGGEFGWFQGAFGALLMPETANDGDCCYAEEYPRCADRLGCSGRYPYRDGHECGAPAQDSCPRAPQPARCQRARGPRSAHAARHRDFALRPERRHLVAVLGRSDCALERAAGGAAREPRAQHRCTHLARPRADPDPGRLHASAHGPPRASRDMTAQN